MRCRTPALGGTGVWTFFLGKIPTGFRPKALGCDAVVTQGEDEFNFFNPNVGCVSIPKLSFMSLVALAHGMNATEGISSRQ